MICCRGVLQIAPLCGTLRAEVAEPQGTRCCTSAMVCAWRCAHLALLQSLWYTWLCSLGYLVTSLSLVTQAVLSHHVQSSEADRTGPLPLGNFTLLAQLLPVITSQVCLRRPVEGMNWHRALLCSPTPCFHLPQRRWKSFPFPS